MNGVNNYLPVAKSNEATFRGILKDLLINKKERPGGFYVPDDLETEAKIETIFEKYSQGKRNGGFTITDFTVSLELATISFADIACLSGGGATLQYSVNSGEIKYLGCLGRIMSFT
ncbi:MAG: hypothetical protein PHE24_00305 [Patescibacteria group bacterium]|nr:hypothetical protein [Patescibacteria group bacterium]